MRKFDYRTDNSSMSVNVNSYIKEMKEELQYLIEIEDEPIYYQSLEKVLEFAKKYPDIQEVQNNIANDLCSSENIEYALVNKKYKEDASLIGCAFQQDLYKIFEIEDQLKQLTINAFIDRMTDFDDIKNGEDFLVVGHASNQLPGLPGDERYRYNEYYGKHYLSCSLLSNLELNTFNGESIFYLVDINKDNYLLGSYFDVGAREMNKPTIYTVGEAEFNGNKRYIDVGYTNDSNKFALSIATPNVIEKMSIKRETEITGQLYKYDVLTNEIVLNRDKTTYKGCLLVADETKLLFSEFIHLMKNNIKFKCINIGLYKEKYGMSRIDSNSLNELRISLKNTINHQMQQLDYNQLTSLLENYYSQVIIPMNYSNEVLAILNEEFSKYIDITMINETINIDDNLNNK